MPKLPIYQSIKNAILANIHSGTWTAGSAIPTEMTLAKQFGVSRMTVNRALQELTAEKVLERRQGSGTFVAQQKFNHTFIEVRNIAKDIIDSHKQYHAEVLTQKTLDSHTLNKKDNTWLKAIFFDYDTPCQDKLYQVNIVHYADNLPVQYEERWVNAHLVPNFINQDFTQVNTSDYLIAQVPLESGDYCISACLAPKHIKNALQMPKNEPALLLTRKTYAQNGMVTLVNMWHAGSRYQFCGHL